MPIRQNAAIYVGHIVSTPEQANYGWLGCYILWCDYSVSGVFEGKSSSDGWKHGSRGLSCFRELLSEETTETLVNATGRTEDYTDDYLSAALFMMSARKALIECAT